MFNLFTALFGGLYYGGKYTHEKSKINKYEKRMEEYEKSYNDLQSALCISFNSEQQIKEYILSGNHYEEICRQYAEDFKFVFGSKWEYILRIPPLPPVLNPKVYKHDAYSFYVPCNHIYWVYRLMLASRGKVDHGLLTQGYSVGGMSEREMCIKFAHCIERRLRQLGHPNLTLVLERNPHGADAIKVDLLCNHDYERMW